MRNALRATTAILLAIPSAAFAQAAPAPDASAAPSVAVPVKPPGPSNELPEITVTAQRQTENAQRAAIAISVIQGSDLLNAGITKVDRLGEFAPALTVEPTSTGNLLFMRGVGNFNVVTGGDPTIAFNYDGVYIGRITSTIGMFYDLERIEVLKGPQGTLYGRNATGGTINVLPAPPKLGERSGHASVSLGNYKAVTTEAALNAPIGDNSAFRISANWAKHDGYLKDGTSDEDTKSARLQFKTQLTPALNMRIAADYSQVGGMGSSVSYLSSYAYNPALGAYTIRPSGLSVSEGIFSPASQAFRTSVRLVPAGRNLDALSPFPFQDNTHYGVNAEINYELAGLGTLTVTPAYRKSSLNYLSGAAAFMYRQHEKDEQNSLEARLSGKKFGIFDYTIGGYYFDESIDAKTVLSISFQGVFLAPNITTRSTAPFGRLTAHLSDTLRVVGGLRYTTDNKTFKQTTTGVTIPCVAGAPPNCPNAVLIPLVDGFAALPYATLPVAGGPPAPLGTGALLVRTDRVDNSRLKNSKLTGRAAIEYDVAPESLFYASFENGYRSGGFSAAQGFETFQPEKLAAYTFGLKNRFLNKRVQLNLEAFSWDYKDQQIQHVGLDTRGITANFTQNIGQSKIKGLEVEGRLLATPTTLLSTTVQYLDAKTLTFVYQQAFSATSSPLTGCAVRRRTDNPALVDVDCSGFPNYNSPKWTVNLAAQQTVYLSNDFKVVFGADTQYKTKRYTGFSYLPEQIVGTTWNSNAQVSFGPDDERWSIAAYVRNIEDNRNAVFSSFHPIANITTAGTTAPRTFGMRFTAKF